jgi:AcrR family transcriptional regulator
MEEILNHDPLRDRLIIAGIAEIGQHGIAGFSLRRVAASCNTSCAAPYKHFKNKDDLILEIIRFVNRQWELLRDQILSLHLGEPMERIVEVCVAYIRFWVANPNYRFALKAPGKAYNASKFSDKPNDEKTIENLTRAYCAANLIDANETERKVYAVKAILYGMTAMLDDGELQNTPQTYENIRETLRRELSI